MSELALTFAAEVVEQQTLLNGTRYLSIEGEAESDAGVWAMALNFAVPKEAGAPLDEGDLTLTGPSGSLVAGLESGETAIVMDDPGEDEQQRLDLTFAVSGGEEGFAAVAGTVLLRGLLTGSSGRLDVQLALEAGPHPDPLPSVGEGGAGPHPDPLPSVGEGEDGNDEETRG
jgi:hypothetical protein